MLGWKKQRWEEIRDTEEVKDNREDQLPGGRGEERVKSCFQTAQN